MKVKFLVSLCGGPKDYHAGDVASFPDKEAIRLVDGNIAESVPKKAYAEVVAKLEEKQAKEDEKQQKIEAIMYEDELKAEKEKLLKRISEIDETLGLTDENSNDNKDSDEESGDGE